MSESNALPVVVDWQSDFAPWFYRLTVCLPLVFFIGAPSLFITRALYQAYHPKEFIGDSPSISGTASEPPSSGFFEAAMLAVTVCIFVTWSLNLLMNHRRLAQNAPQAGLTSGPALLNMASCLFGLVAGTFLAMLGVYNLGTGHDIHMLSSWVFYVSQVLAFLLDIGCIMALQRSCAALPSAVERMGLRYRLAVGGSVFVVSLVFLTLYLAKNSVLPANRYAMQLVYVGSENILCLLCFSYPLAKFPEMRRHYRERIGSAQAAWPAHA